MKKSILSSLMCVFVSAAMAQVVSLPAPDMGRACLSTIDALACRKSIREFSDKDLTLQDLSDLLWAACGKNREDGRLTAPTAMNRQEVRVFVFTAEAVSEYLPQTNQLKQFAKGDSRSIVAGSQIGMATAPVFLVMVADMDKYGVSDESAIRMATVDAGIISQNINLFCAATGMATVTRGTMDTRAISRWLSLKSTQIPIVNNPVGFPDEK